MDSSSDAYVTGYTTSSNIPTTPDAYQIGIEGVVSAFVTKLNASGSVLVYSTYLGGDNLDFANGIAVDLRGNAYVTGETLSADFPTGAFQTSLAGRFDAFVTKFRFAPSIIVAPTDSSSVSGALAIRT